MTQSKSVNSEAQQELGVPAKSQGAVSQPKQQSQPQLAKEDKKTTQQEKISSGTQKVVTSQAPKTLSQKKEDTIKATDELKVTEEAKPAKQKLTKEEKQQKKLEETKDITVSLKEELNGLKALLAEISKKIVSRVEKEIDTLVNSLPTSNSLTAENMKSYRKAFKMMLLDIRTLKVKVDKGRRKDIGKIEKVVARCTKIIDKIK